MLRHTRNCGLPKTFTEPNRDREGAETQEITAVGGGRFLTGAVRKSCSGTLPSYQGGKDGGRSPHKNRLCSKPAVRFLLRNLPETTTLELERTLLPCIAHPLRQGREKGYYRQRISRNAVAGRLGGSTHAAGRPAGRAKFSDQDLQGPLFLGSATYVDVQPPLGNVRHSRVVVVL